MPTYAVTASYSPEHWARLLHAPAARGVGLRRAVADVGGTVSSMHWSADTLELVAIVGVPDTASMVAVHASLASTGVFTSFISRQLLGPDELDAAIGIAGGVGLAPAEPPSDAGSGHDGTGST